MKTVFALYYVFFFIGITFVTFASATDLKFGAPDKINSTKNLDKALLSDESDYIFAIFQKNVY